MPEFTIQAVVVRHLPGAHLQRQLALLVLKVGIDR